MYVTQSFHVKMVELIFPLELFMSIFGYHPNRLTKGEWLRNDNRTKYPPGPTEISYRLLESKTNRKYLQNVKYTRRKF